MHSPVDPDAQRRVVVSGTVTRKDMAGAVAHHTLRSPPVVILLVLSAAFFPFVLASPPRDVAEGLLVGGVTGAVAATVLLLSSLPRASIRVNPSTEEVRFVLGEDGFSTSSARDSVSVAWERVTGASDTRHAVIVEIGHFMLYAVPKRLMRDAAHLEAVRRVLRENVRGKVRLKG